MFIFFSSKKKIMNSLPKRNTKRMQQQVIKDSSSSFLPGTTFKQEVPLWWFFYNNKNQGPFDKCIPINEILEEDVSKKVQQNGFCITSVLPVKVSNNTGLAVRFYCKSHKFLDRSKFVDNKHVLRCFAEAQPNCCEVKISNKRFISIYTDRIYSSKPEDWKKCFLLNYSIDGEKEIFKEENTKFEKKYNTLGHSKKFRYIDLLISYLDKIGGEIPPTILAEIREEFKNGVKYRILQEKVLTTTNVATKFLFHFPDDNIPRVGFSTELPKFSSLIKIREKMKKFEEGNFDVNIEHFDNLVNNTNTFIKKYLQEKKKTQNNEIVLQLKLINQSKGRMKIEANTNVTLTVEFTFEVL